MTKLADFATATLLEAHPEVRSLPASIVPLSRPVSLCGPAFTVRCDPGDNLGVHRALAEACSGKVLVVATGAALGFGFWGEITTVAAIQNGVRGLVTDGCVRDTREIRQSGFPVFCGGIAIPGTTKKSKGDLNIPVTIGDIRVMPGDIIVGDDDGVVSVPAAIEADVLEKAGARLEKEVAILGRLRKGELTMDLLGLRTGSLKDEQHD